MPTIEQEIKVLAKRIWPDAFDIEVKESGSFAWGTDAGEFSGWVVLVHVDGKGKQVAIKAQTPEELKVEVERLLAIGGGNE